MNFPDESLSYMKAALREAQRALDRDEVPVGAVIVQNGIVIAKGHNQTELLKDPTAHAEMIAITSAATHIGDWRLNECDIYVTLEPCIMCTGALLAARIRNLYYAIPDSKFGACGSVHNLAENSKTNHRINVYSGMMEDEVKSLMNHFFQAVREKKQEEKKTRFNNFN